jgi:hypothetical protein
MTYTCNRPASECTCDPAMREHCAHGGYYACKQPPGGCGCPREARGACRWGQWVSARTARAWDAARRQPDPLTIAERRLVDNAREDSAPTGESEGRPPTDIRRETRRLIAIIDRLTGRLPSPQDRSEVPPR